MGLKVETIIPQGTTISLQMYSKAEVDKYIADLENKLQRSVDAHNELFDELRRTIKVKELLIDEVMRQKFIRCLRVIEICELKISKIQAGVIRTYTYPYMQTCPAECNPKYEFWTKWRDRWYKIAEKFKV